MFTLEDPAGFLWTVSTDQNGRLFPTKGSLGPAPPIFLNDLLNTTSWMIEISTLGLLQEPATQVPYIRA
jgi:hypothetical protein